MARHKYECDVNWDMGDNVQCTCGDGCGSDCEGSGMSERADLIRKLRDYRGGYCHERDCRDAANAIEKCDDRIAELEAALRESTLWHKQCYNLMDEKVYPESRYELNKQIAANERLLGEKT